MRQRVVPIAVVVLALIAGAALGRQQVPPPQNAKVSRDIAVSQIPALLVRINAVRCEHDGSPLAEYNIDGLNFGDPRGARRILVDGVPATNYLIWHNGNICIKAPQGALIKWYHEYVFAVENGSGKILSNQLKVRFPIAWDGANPGSAAPGSAVTLNAWGAGPNQGSKVLHMDGAIMQVTGWAGGAGVQIKAIVPPIAPGSHKIYLTDGADKISTDLNFTVL